MTLPEKKPQKDIVLQSTTDFYKTDFALVEKFKEDGLPGIAALAPEKFQKMTDLYLNGKTYRQISRMLGVKRSLVLYLSDKYKWYETKQLLFYELEHNIAERVLESKIKSQDFLLQLAQMWEIKMGKKIDKYITTGDDDHAKEIDTKEVAQYIRTIQTIQELNGQVRPPNSKPSIGINAGDGVSVKKVGDNEFEITPKAKAIGDLLKQFADEKREAENKQKKPVTSDISKETKE